MLLLGIGMKYWNFIKLVFIVGKWKNFTSYLSDENVYILKVLLNLHFYELSYRCITMKRFYHYLWKIPKRIHWKRWNWVPQWFVWSTTFLRLLFKWRNTRTKWTAVHTVRMRNEYRVDFRTEINIFLLTLPEVNTM